MKRHRIYLIITLAVFFVQLFLNGTVFAATTPIGVYHQTPPTNVDAPVAGITYDVSTGKYFAGLTWTKATIDSSNVPDATIDPIAPGPITDIGYNIYTMDTNDLTGAFKTYPLSLSFNDPVSGTPRNTYQLDKNGSEDLKSGTIYTAKMQAYHTHTNTTGTTSRSTTHNSIDSNSVNFMTDIALEVIPAGSDTLEIKWDDVWYGANRIAYEIHISESNTFSRDTMLTVTSANIGATGPVIPLTGERKLLYKVKGSFLKDSTLYYVKIKPIISDPKVRYNTVDADENIKAGYTNIVTSMTKISDGWWKIVWNPVTDSTLQGGEKVKYTIRKGLISAAGNAIFEDVAVTTDTKYYININDNTYFYMIVADIKDGFGNRILDSLGYGIKSGKLFGIEADVPTNPTVPDLKTLIYANPADTSTLLYNDSIANWLLPKEATIAWTPPTLGDGINIDTNISYDIYLMTDPSKIDDPTVKPYSSGLKTFTQITDNSGKVFAYTFRFQNLTPNTAYYLKLIAKKTYTVNNNGVLQVQDFLSLPALKVIITPPSGSIDQPVAPVKPPFKIKTLKDSQGNEIPDVNGNPTTDDIGKTNVWIQWQNRWGENRNGANWYYVDLSGQDAANNADGTPPDKAAEEAAEAAKAERIITYDINTTFSIGYVEFSDTLDYQTLKTLPMQIQGIPNVTTGSAYTLLYNLDKLKPNTTYVIWMRAYNPNVGLLSEPSDPVIAVTLPDLIQPIEKPKVPTFNYNKAGDTSVDLQWDYKTDYSYTYYIKYATSDNIPAAQKTVTVKPTDLMTNSVFTITGLSQNTTYYFWIQADSTGKEVSDGMSFWSDAYPVKTLPYAPPLTPKGFGVKSTATAIGKNNITYEWVQETGLQYTLEIASDINYKDAKKYVAGAVTEYNATGLLSNHRYYSRLYAIDPSKGNIISLPTESVTTRTLKSNDDYDADVDTENIITGPFVIDGGPIDGVETKSIIGANADRFIEKVQTDKVLDYLIDFTDTSYNSNMLKVSDKVMSSLSNLKENIILDVGFCKFTIRPGLIDPALDKQLKNKLGNYNIELAIKTEDLTSNEDLEMRKNGLVYRTEAGTLTVNAVNGANSIPINQFYKPVRASFKYTAEDFYAEGKTIGYYYDDNSKSWVQQPTSAKYNKTLEKGYISFDLSYPDKAAILVKGSSSVIYDDISGVKRYAQISALAFKYNLKSVDSTKFKPNDNLTIGGAAKLAMDILDYKYDENYGSTALKARFISPSDLSNIDGNCSRKKALQTVDRLYEIKTGSKPEARTFSQDDEQPITRGDFAGELYIMLSKIGEV